MSFETPLTVTELTHQIKDCLEGNFSRVAVLGELSNTKRAGSGHVYLTLKDDAAQLQAVIWRTRASAIKFDLHDGLEVVAVGRIDLYPARGSYQLIIDALVPHGVGPLELAFRQLHDKLAAEGLFDPERKQPLPALPRRIALVTSPQGAAVRDLLQVIGRRWPAVDIVIVPVPVQGEGSAERIARGIAVLPSLDVDVAVVGRGGGSLEDLWSFNEEVVARAIAACHVPIISAVGHEVDVTIADLVADRRAATPSEAGEIVVPDRQEFRSTLRTVRSRMTALLQSRASAARNRLESVASRPVFSRPFEQINQLRSRLDEIETRLTAAGSRRVRDVRSQVAGIASALDALSPLRVLQRGYSLTTRADSGELVRSSDGLEIGDRLHTRLSEGSVISRIERVDS